MGRPRGSKTRNRKWCQKCGRTYLIHKHHIVARQDGGEEGRANVAELCEPCHREWHSLEMYSTCPFYLWLEMPPVGHMIAALTSGSEVVRPVLHTLCVMRAYVVGMAEHGRTT